MKVYLKSWTLDMSHCNKYILLRCYSFLISSLLSFGCAGCSPSPEGFSLVAVSWGCSLDAVCGLLTAAASLVVALRLLSSGPVAMAHRLSCFTADGIVSNQGSKACPLRWQANSYPLHHYGSPKVLSLMPTLGSELRSPIVCLSNSFITQAMIDPWPYPRYFSRS